MSLTNARLKQDLTIRRTLFRKKTSELEVIINDIPQKDKFPSINDGNTFLIKLLGVNREDLLNFYLISKEKYVSFYRSSDNDKKGVISRFSNANLIEGVDTIIQSMREEADKWNIDSYRANFGGLSIWITNSPYSDMTINDRRLPRRGELRKALAYCQLIKAKSKLLLNLPQ